MSLFSFLNRGEPTPAVGIAPAAPATPLSIRLRHIDIELAKLVAVQPRTENTWGAIDHWLDRRLVAKLVPPAPERRFCERCEREILPGQPYRFEPGTGGLVVHSDCGGGEGGAR